MPELPTGVREGEVLAGKYRIGEVLGAGAMGTVFAAHHLLLDQKLAIKVLIPQASSNPEALGRFMREARAAVRIKSEHVVRVLDVAIDSGVPYIVMEHLDGCDLAEWLRRHGPLSVELATDFVLQACDAIHEAHGLDIIHRDIKPPNLFAVQRRGVVQTIKVLDFGISKTMGIVPATIGAADWKPGSVVTEDRVMIGSPFYMSPEQMESARDVDARTDVWALGVTLYELVTGKLPFHGQSLLQVYSQIVSDPPLRLRDSAPHVPPGLEAVIGKCLERRREERYCSVSELAMALVGFGSSRAVSYVERMARSVGEQETASTEEAMNLPHGLPVPLSEELSKTLASPGRIALSVKTKRSAPFPIVLVAATLFAALALGIASMLRGFPQRSPALSASGPEGSVSRPVPAPDRGSKTVQTTAGANARTLEGLAVEPYAPAVPFVAPAASRTPPSTSSGASAASRRAVSHPVPDAGRPAGFQPGSASRLASPDASESAAIGADWTPPAVPK